MLPVSFIKATDEYCDFDHPVNAPLFRRSFTLDAVPNSASSGRHRGSDLETS